MEAFEHLLDRTNALESHLSTLELVSIYKDIKSSLKELEDAQEKQESKEAAKYLVTFCKIMDKIAHDVVEAKQRYQTLDKQQLIDDRLLQIATNIKFFRKEAQNYNAQINQTDQNIRQVSTKNESIYFHNQCLKRAIANKESQKQRSKNIYITQEDSMERQVQCALNRLQTSKFTTSQKPRDEQCKTVTSFNNYRYSFRQGSVESKRSHFQSKKLSKVWNYSTKMTNKREE